MTQQLRHNLSLLLLLAMLSTQIGHLSSLSAVVHKLEPASDHHHDSQSFHQTVGIHHQHLQQAPDHLHDTPQPVSESPISISIASEQPDTYLIHPPNAPSQRIERPPRVVS